MPERHYHANGRVVASREQRGAGLVSAAVTPRGKEKTRDTLAVQDPGLKDYVYYSPFPYSLELLTHY